VPGEIFLIIIHSVGPTTANYDSDARVKVKTVSGNAFLGTAEPDDCDDSEDAQLPSSSEMDSMDKVPHPLPTANTVPDDTKSLPSGSSMPTLTDFKGDASPHNDKSSESDDEREWQFV